MNIHQLTGAAMVATSLLMNGCASGDSRPSPSASSSNYSAYGVVESIDVIDKGKGGIAGSGIGAGAVIGGVVGGLLGNQVGAGSGKTAATVVGVAGGAVVGHEIQKRRNANNPNEVYRVHVRLDQGGSRSVDQTDIGDLRVGDHVHINNGAVYRD